MDQNEHSDQRTFKIMDDPRITPPGRILRRLSIDELPQLINILRGDMSILGPRPPLPGEVALYSAYDFQRLAVKPGLTCIWQVSGRSRLAFSSQVKMDLEYIRNRSLKTDLAISPCCAQWRRGGLMSLDKNRSAIFGIRIDRVTMEQAIDRLGSWIDQKDRACRYVVTPNLDHAVQLQSNEALREAYQSASLIVADGWPLVTASRIFQDPLPERVAGSDLVPGLFQRLHESADGGTVYLLGAAPGVAKHAARKIEQRWSRVKVVGTHSPPFGFEKDTTLSDDAVRRINDCSPDVLVVGLGAPKQELWLNQFQSQLSVGVAIAAGGTIDFLAGRQTRAPRWVQKLRMEWSHRMLTNPGRLTGRYARNAWHLPRLLLQEHFTRKASFRPRPSH